MDLVEKCYVCLFYNDRLCRRFPPQLTEHIGVDSKGSSITGTFPLMHPDEWCGEFIRKPND